MPPESCDGIAVLEAAEAEEAEEVPRLAPALGGADAAHLERVLDVLERRAPREERVLLEDVGDLRVRPGHAGRVDEGLAAGGLGQAADDVEQHRLAAAARADERDELAPADGEVDAGEHRHAVGHAGRRR